MSTTSDMEITPADDGFERHYAEKIWALIPEVYRNEDGLSSEPGRLRALVEILADQAAIARRSSDRLWADTRVDEADDWAIPYLGTLLGSRPVNALNRAGERANLGRTILYRRRLGTPRLLERLADDIADWDAVVSEAFKRLPRNWHMLDGGPLPGMVTTSPQWGYPDLRNARADDLPDSAHDEFSHYPDVRRHRGQLGRYNIPKVNLHLFRQFAFPLSRVTPFRIDDELYTLDPSGRDAALFQVGGRKVKDCVEAREWEMRAPLSCRRLNSAGFRPIQTHAPVGLADELIPIYGRRFTTEAAMLDAANAALAENPALPNQLNDTQSAHLIADAMETATPRRNLFPGGDPTMRSVAIALAADFASQPLGPQHIYGANLDDWAQDHDVPGWVEALVDAANGRLRLMNPLPADRDVHVQSIFYGAFWPVGAGTYERDAGLTTTGFTPVASLQPNFTGTISGEFRFMDSRTYTPQIPANGVIEVDGDLTLSAADGERPYVTLIHGGDPNVTLHSNDSEAELVIDGLWLGVFQGGSSASTQLIINGSWRKVTLRNMTLDPGGIRAAAPGQAAEVIPDVELAFAGAIDHIEIDGAILGRIQELFSETDPCATDTARICNSIIFNETGFATIFFRNTELTLENSTIFGNLITGSLRASQTLVDGQVRVEDRQSGCFRFSAAAAGNLVPHPYESHFFDGGLPTGTFVSRRFGDAGFAQLSEIAPIEIREGGEGGTEIGAFNRALDPIKRADLRAKIDEFMPINAITQLVFET